MTSHTQRILAVPQLREANVNTRAWVMVRRVGEVFRCSGERWGELVGTTVQDLITLAGHDRPTTHLDHVHTHVLIRAVDIVPVKAVRGCSQRLLAAIHDPDISGNTLRDHPGGILITNTVGLHHLATLTHVLRGVPLVVTDLCPGPRLALEEKAEGGSPYREILGIWLRASIIGNAKLRSRFSCINKDMCYNKIIY